MPTEEQFEAFIKQLAGFVPLGGEVMSLAEGSPSMLCAYLIDLINQKMRQIAQDTAVSGLSSEQATAYQHLQDLKSRIAKACDETGEPDEIEEPDELGVLEPPPDPVDESDGTIPSGPSLTTSTPPTVQTKPPTKQSLCCSLHGNEPPVIDVSQLRVEFVHGGLTIQGNVTVSHPCGIRSYQTQMFVRDSESNEYRFDNHDHQNPREHPEKNINLNFGGMPLRGFASAWVQVNAKSVCGSRAQVIKTPFGVAIS